MISFENIDKFDRVYDFCMNYLCVVHNHIYYKHFYILNKENIPKKGEPTIVIANHQNGLMDALAILHTMFLDRRQPVFIARGDLFKKDRMAKILRFLKIMPSFRTRDAKNREDILENLSVYNKAARILKAGGTIVIFPEATHQHGHYMNTFKKGFCRIAFSAEEENDYQINVKVLPLNIHYSNYFNFHSDLMVTVGEPFTYEELYDMYKNSPNEAYLALNEKARARVKAITPDIDIPEYLNEIEDLTQMMNRPLLRHEGKNPNYFPNQKNASMTIIEKVRQYRQKDEEGFISLMEKMRKFKSMLKDNGLPHWVFNKKTNIFKLICRIIGMVALLPFFIFGVVNNLVPRLITKVFADKAKDPMFHSSFQYVVGTFLVFPLCYILLFALVWILSKKFLFALGYLILTFATAFLVHHYRIWWHNMMSFFRAMRMRKTKTFKDMSQLNDEITSKMVELLFE